MAGTRVTTREVADLLSVSEATVKRWADDGMIESEKTVGGHRRFSLENIATFRRDRGWDRKASAHLSPLKTESVNAKSASASDLFDRLLQAQEDAAAALLIEAYLGGEELSSLFDSAITMAMHRVGDLWGRGELSVADEHLAVRTAMAALQRLRNVVQATSPTGMTALICGVENDLHELPLHLIQIMFECDGWKVLNLGPNTPFFTLAEGLAKHRPQLTCVSAKWLSDPDRATREYDQVRKISNRLKIAIAIGGDGFADPIIRQRFPADFYAEDFSNLLGYARSIVLDR